MKSLSRNLGHTVDWLETKFMEGVIDQKAALHTFFHSGIGKKYFDLFFLLPSNLNWNLQFGCTFFEQAQIETDVAISEFSTFLMAALIFQFASKSIHSFPDHLILIEPTNVYYGNSSDWQPFL